MEAGERRAEPPQPPAKSAELLRQDAERAKWMRARLRVEQRSLLRGLLLLAVVILLASLAHAGFGRLFVAGWWRQW
jgi:hypothetical protein